LERSASEAVIPESWLLPDAIEIRRLRMLLDQTRPADSLDGLFDLEVPFPPIPGLTAAHPTSASRLRDFIGCPHKFLFSSVFHWREPERLPEINGLDALAYGALFHATVELLYRAHGEMIAAGRRRIEELEGEIDAAVHASFENKLGTHPLVNESVCRQEKARLRRDVTTFVDLDLQETKRFVDVERRFGWERPQGISFGAVQIHVRGSIDRLDVLEREGFVLVRDLKSGKERGKKEKGSPVPDLGHDLQLVVYGLVTQANAKAWGVPSRVAVAYVHPSDARNPDREFRDDFVGVCEIFDQKLGAQLKMLMERAFPRTPNPDDCEYCPFKPVCGPRAFQRANSVLDDARGAVQAFREEKRKE
jgi:RecB family exonuclease